MASIQLRSNQQYAREIEALATAEVTADVVRAAELLEQSLPLVLEAVALAEPFAQALQQLATERCRSGQGGSVLEDEVTDTLLVDTPFGTASNAASRILQALDGSMIP